jgi:hypothetical protein
MIEPWSILLYADDMLLISLSLTRLQENVNTVNDYLHSIGLSLNTSKSSFIRIGPRFSCTCEPISLHNGDSILQVEQIMYLGVCFKQAKRFRCVFDTAKTAFSKAANGIFGKLLGKASDECLLYLLDTNCMPILLYGIEAVPVANFDIHSLDFWTIRFLFKLFKCFDKSVAIECAGYFGFMLPSCVIQARRGRFYARYKSSNNSICKFVSLFY